MSFENDKSSVYKDAYEWCLKHSKRLKVIDPPMNIQMINQKLLTQLQGQLVNAVKFRFNQLCTLDDISHTFKDTTMLITFQRKNKFYAMEQMPEEETPAKDSESDSMGDSIRENSDDDQKPEDKLMVEYQ
ncbi:hypothetical protein O181_000198 [Austropuccinia psidii MF-1]|uniref:Uncharacterized protein n=1 Tax=Austropuccinia psidii MF-1 TaxID=1389203 RepID=A0A9Q3B8C5_9BASI|nr:hypothetical protein [Austropuccinia psidii MF-1]